MDPGTTTQVPRQSRLQRRKERTRAAIVDAAGALFDERGYDQTSILQVAERADTGVGTLYGYFRSKEDLLQEVLNQRSARALQSYVSSLPSGAGALERTLAGLRLLAEFIRENRPILRATFQATAFRGNEQREPPAEQIFRAFRDMLASDVAAGDLRQVPIDTTARALIGLHLMAVLGIGIFREMADDPAQADDLQTITRMLLER